MGLIETNEHGLVRGMLFVTTHTGNCHIIEADGESVCGRMTCELDEVQEYDPKRERHRSGDIVYGPTPFYNMHRAVIHVDGMVWRKSKHSLCSFCDDLVPDEIQAELFGDEDTFGYIDGVTTEVTHEHDGRATAR